MQSICNMKKYAFTQFSYYISFYYYSYLYISNLMERMSIFLTQKCELNSIEKN